MYRFLLFLFAFSVSYITVAQQSTGLLPIQKFNSDNLGAQPHCFAFTQDSRKAIYVGNKDGLLVYTGIWKKFITDNATEIRALSVAFDGNIYIGNQKGFGYFAPNDTGSFVYYPLDTLLEKEQRTKVTNTQIVVAFDSVVYFVSGKYLYKYYNNKIDVFPTTNEIGSMFVINGRILIVIKGEGLFELLNNELKPVITSDKYFYSKDGNKIFTIGPLQYFGNNKILYLSQKPNNDEFRILDLNTKKDIKFNTQIDSIINAYKAQSLHTINNSLIAVRIQNNGVIVIDNEGNFVRKLDKSSGLQSDVVEKMFVDNNNILWTAHKTGISRIDVFSNYQYFPLEKLGIKNTIESIKVFNDTLFIAIQNQLSFFEKNDVKSKGLLSMSDINKLSNPKCLAVNNPLSKGQGCYDLLNFEIDNYRSLLFITNNHIVEKKLDGSMNIAYPKSGYKLFQDLDDPHRVWISLYPKGLASMYYKVSDSPSDGEWINEGTVENTEFEIFDLNSDKNNNIWMGSYGIIRLSTPSFINHKIVNPNTVVFDTVNGLSVNDAFVIHRDNDKMLFASDDGLYEFNSDKNFFTKSDYFGEWMKGHHTLRFYKDKHNKTWTVSYPEDHSKIFIKSFTANSEGSYFMNTEYSKQIKARRFLSFCHYDKGLFAAGDFSIVKLDYAIDTDTNSQINVFINKIEKTGKKTLFGGAYTNSDGKIVSSQSKESIPTLDYKDNNLVFKYSAITTKVTSNIEYRVWLEGNDDDWENWNDKAEIRFTNLHEGEYTFWIQARDIYGNESEKLSYSFTVDPPWNRTVLAYIIYLLLFGVFVWASIQYSTRKLKLIINDATAEIQDQKKNIEHKNEEIISSIRYAQRIQEAVVPNESQMNKAFENHFVLWKPRDIVSGDYYWMMEKNGKIILAAADCTGHGVPGAFMSIMGISFLNEIANNPNVQSAASALDMLRMNVVTSLNQEGSETNTKDGMDMSICVYDFEEMTMEFAGAYNPMYMIRDGELSTVKADRMPIGIHERDKNPFTNIKFDMHKGDVYYILSDGYIDQFGGPKGKKFMTKKFKKLILEIHHKPMDEQREILWQTLLEWRGDIEQLDDIIVIGVRV